MSSVEDTYNLGNSESDDSEGEDEVTVEVEPKKKLTNSKNSLTQVQMRDIKNLKEQTTELLDPSWKETRNQQLLKKMLELDEPAITPKMVDFLLQDGVVETLISFITLLNKGPRPMSSASPTPELITSYKTTVLLTAEAPSNELMAVITRKVGVMARAAFDIFRPESAGSFYHAYRLIDCLLRCCPAEFYNAICSDGRLYDRMASLLHYIGYAPVPDIFVCIITLAPIARSSSLFAACAKSRWTFFEHLSEWTMILRIAEVVVRPKEFCCLKDGVSLEEHSSCAAQLLQELSEKLSLEETGEILLHPLGYTTEILDYLVFTGVNPNIVEPIRRASLKLLCFLLKRSAEPELLCMVSVPGREQPVPMCVPNRMHHLRGLMVEHLTAILGEVFRILVNYDSTDGLSPEKLELEKTREPVTHIGYSVAKPFTTMRLLLFEFAVCMVEASETVALAIPVELWTTLMTWILRYAYNNIFHAYFYRLLFAVLRQNNDDVLKILFQKAKLMTFLLDTYYNYPKRDDDLLPKVCEQELRCRDICRGLVLNCLNAIRLQAASLPPDAFLRQFLEVHLQWDEYEEVIANATDFQREIGFGLRMLDGNRQEIGVGTGAGGGSSILSMSFSSASVDIDGVELGSRYAGSLGFTNEIAWPDSAMDKKRSLLKRQKRRESRIRSESNSSIDSDSSAGSTSSSISSLSMPSMSSLSISTEGPGAARVEEDDVFYEENKDFLEDRNSPVPPSIGVALGGVLRSTHAAMTPRPSENSQVFDAPSAGGSPYIKTLEQTEQEVFEQDVANNHVSAVIAAEAEANTADETSEETTEATAAEESEEAPTEE